MVVVGVQPADLDAVLPRIEWHLRSFADRSEGRTTVRALVDEIRSGARQCWVAVDDGAVHACALSQVEISEIKEVTITHCAGSERAGWQSEILAEIRAWAEHIGAERLTVVCRPGWAKFLKGEGLRETHRVLEVELNG